MRGKKSEAQMMRKRRMCGPIDAGDDMYKSVGAATVFRLGKY